MPLLRRRSLLLPTRRGWLLILLLLAATSIVSCRLVHPFLAVTAPIEADTLVIEGWLSDYAIETGADTYTRGPYQRIFVTGAPLEKAVHLAGYETYADSGAAVLLQTGLSPDVVIAVSSTERYQNRTYASALALRDYCATNHIALRSINVVTSGTHARRSRLCFRRALGPSVQVGVIAVPSRDYDPDRWWRQSAGVKAVLSELIALPYATVGLDYGK
jgi:uncharacterized SAM-binding protein YcdF (DUF218 family)